MDRSGAAWWRIFDHPAYAENWYAAREEGEHLRGKALEWLYARWPHPGGPHPDPRLSGAFSGGAVLGAAARILQIKVVPLGAISTGGPAKHPTPPVGATNAEPLAWLMTYPDSPPTAHAAPEIWFQAQRSDISQARLNFDMACLLGYIYRDRHRLLDPDAPPGITLIPHDPGLIAILHQFANALLHLGTDCPPGSICHCNTIRQRYNRSPEEHDQPTDALTLEDLAQELQEGQEGQEGQGSREH